MRPVPNRAPKRMTIDVNDARLKAERSALHEVSGKVGTGIHGNKGTRRARTKGAANTKAIQASKEGN